MASPTPNKGYTYPAHGGAVDAWDTPLNTNFDQIDLNVGGYYPITVTSTASTVTYNSSGAIASSTAATVTPPSSLAQNLFYTVSGTLTQAVKLVLPQAGGFYQIRNATSGSFDLTVGSASGTAVTVSQGGTNMVAADGTNFYLSNSNPNAAKLYTYLGNPNGAVTGSIGATNGSLTDAVWDSTNRQLYVPSAAGTGSWNPQLSRLVPEGILTVNNSTVSPIVTSDTTGTTIYYTPYIGNWTLLSNGTILFPYQFSQLSLALTASQAANQIYDIFMWWNSGTPVIGTGPSWTVGGGSVSAGSCARGTGAGSTALARFQGILVNSVQVTLTNGASTYACPANEGIYLGSIFMDTSAGAVTCHRSAGQSRKWGVWNNYNRGTVNLIMFDSTASWTYSSATVRQSRATTANTVQNFSGLAETSTTINFSQLVQGDGGAGSTVQASVGIGVNSTTTVSMFGTGGSAKVATTNVFQILSARTIITPGLGFNNINSLEAVPGGFDIRFYGGSSQMMLVAEFLA
jgi:hypothetical protein